jgi:hypothetical protein
VLVIIVVGVGPIAFTRNLLTNVLEAYGFFAFTNSFTVQNPDRFVTIRPLFREQAPEAINVFLPVEFDRTRAKVV